MFIFVVVFDCGRQQRPEANTPGTRENHATVVEPAYKYLVQAMAACQMGYERGAVVDRSRRVSSACQLCSEIGQTGRVKTSIDHNTAVYPL